MRVTVESGLLAEIKKLSKQERKDIGDAMRNAALSWGNAHVHSGISIRRLRGDVYECRVGLADRLVFLFVATPPELIFYFLGDHDDVKKHLKTLK